VISQLQLAKQCGVSQGTVDRALHNRGGVSQATRGRILAAAEKHGYFTHPAAREILTGENRTVGALVPQINSAFFMDLVSRIKETLRAARYRFMIVPVTDRRELEDTLTDFASRRAAGVILIPPGNRIRIADRYTENMKVITCVNPCAGENTVFVGHDEHQTGAFAAAYLAGRGHRRVLHLTYSRDSYAGQARRDGFCREMNRRQLHAFVEIFRDTLPLVKTLQDNRITAIFCHNDWLALRALRLLEQKGLRAPDDVSILGVDHSPTFTQLCPDITSIRYPYEWVAGQVLNVIQGNSPAAFTEELTVVERNT